MFAACVFFILQPLGSIQRCAIQHSDISDDDITFTSSSLRPRGRSAAKNQHRLFRHAFWSEERQGKRLAKIEIKMHYYHVTTSTRKWECMIFQSGKSQGILNRLEKSGNFT